MLEPERHSNQNQTDSHGFGFSASSIFDSGFSCPEIPTRLRPRLVKTRRKRTVPSRNGDSVRTELELNGFSGGNDEVKGLEEGLRNEGFRIGGLGLRDGYVFNLGLGNGGSLFGSRMNGRTSSKLRAKGSKGGSSSDVEKGNGSFVFGGFEEGPKIDQEENGASVFGGFKETANVDQAYGVSNIGSGSFFVFGGRESNHVLNSETSVRESSGESRRTEVDGFGSSGSFEFMSGFDKNVSNSDVSFEQKGSNKPVSSSSLDELGKQNNSSFVFRASKDASTAAANLDSQKQHCSKSGVECGSSEDVQNAVPDMRGKVKQGSSGNSEKVIYPCFGQSNWSDSSRKNDVNFVFGSAKADINLGENIASKNGGKPDSANCSKGNAETEHEFQNVSLNGGFIFGGLKGNEGFSFGVNSVAFDEINPQNREKAENCNGFREQDHDVKYDTKAKSGYSCNSGVDSEKDPVHNLADGIKRLNVDGPETNGYKTQNYPGNVSASTSDAFVFASTHKNGCDENHRVTASDKTQKLNPSSQSSTESNRTSSPLFPSTGVDIRPNGGYSEVPPKENEKTEGVSFTSNLFGFGLSGADDSMPSMKFTFSGYDMYPGVGRKSDTANSKSFRGKKSKKTNRKQTQRTFIQQFFSQDQPPEAGDSLQHTKSPGCGSPMDFSPYQDTGGNGSPTAGSDATLKQEEFPGNEKDSLKHLETRGDAESASKLSSPLPAPDGLSAIRRQYRKKYKLKVGVNHYVQSNDSHKENVMQVPGGAAVDEVCEHWRIRGNQAYHAGKLSKAEEFYSTGISSIPVASTLGNSIKPLLLCYSNRAATRMSLGRMREAIGDCRKAAELDPNFLKAMLRAGNCYLVLGEVEEAIQCYNKCLISGPGICLDRRATIEGADGLQKAKKVAEYMSQSAKLLHEATQDAASRALENIIEALSISRYSEKLLEMKGEALCTLRRYDEVIQLCEQTLHTAEKNFGDHLEDLDCKSSRVKLWRCQLLTKAHYHLGKLDRALDMIEQQDRIPLSSRFGDVTQDSSFALADIIRELLRLKRSGNEAFRSGMYTEAIDHYTAAISRSVESRPFMAVCFCNRAAAYQATSQVIDAIADCSLAIALNENYEKAISRRVTLHEMIRDYKQALLDLQRLISLLESQSQAKNQQCDTRRESSAGSVRDLKKARRRLSLIEEKVKKDIPMDLYLILGIKATDTESEIKKAYRKAALRHHPDKVLARSDVGENGTLWKEVGDKIHEDADRLFKIIGEAYAVLSDPSKRSEYDDREEMRSYYWNSNRNSNSGHPSTSYNSPSGRGSWYGRQGAGFSTSSERSSNSRRHWYDSRSYSNSYTRW